MMRASVSTLVLVCGLGLELSSAAAQSDPGSTPLQPSFSLQYPPDDVPSPCFEFACWNGAEFDGDTLAAVGATYAGIYLFVKNRSGEWQFQQLIEGPTSEPPYVTAFAEALALKGDDLLFNGGDGNTYVYHRAFGRWTLQQALPFSASTIALDDGKAAITSNGAVRIYQKSRHGDYRLQSTISRPDSADGIFGSTLALDGNTLLVGAPVDRYGSGVGAAYVFEQFCGRWVFVQKFTPDGGVADTHFATTLDVDRGRIAIGAPYTPAPSADQGQGAIQIYSRRGWQWREEQVITNRASNSPANAFGTALDLDGRRLLAGGDTFDPWQTGVNHLYALDHSGQFRETATLAAGDPQNVRISGRSALVDVIGFRAGTYPVIFDLPN